MEGGDENESQEGEEDKLPFPIPPIAYFERRARESPPQSVQGFLDANYQFLAIAGVFAALIVSLSGFGSDNPVPIVLGMVGGALMFLIAFLVVIHNASIAFFKACRVHSLRYSLAYWTMICSLLLIGAAIVSYFTRFPSASIAALNLISAQVLLIAFVLVVQGVFTLPSPLRSIDPPFEVQLGPYTDFLVRKSIRLSGVIMGILLIISQLGVVEIDIPDIRIPVPISNAIIALILVSIGGFVITVGIIIASISVNLIYRKLSGAFEYLSS